MLLFFKKEVDWNRVNSSEDIIKRVHKLFVRIYYKEFAKIVSVNKASIRGSYIKGLTLIKYPFKN